MRWSHPLAIFLLSVGTGAVLVSAAFGVTTWQRKHTLPVHALAPGIAISEQLQPRAMGAARERYNTVIDMRPDGEAADQPGSAEMEAAAKAHHLQFAYVPVPHGDIPDEVVDKLANAMASRPGPVLLYCRSGRRAARSWSLVEASRTGGLGADEILAAVKASGQDASDLRAKIEKRIQARKPLPGAAA
jgi:uncharacterized protein (TIGR01244 family)